MATDGVTKKRKIRPALLASIARAWKSNHMAGRLSAVIWLIVAGTALGAEGTFDGVYSGKRVLTKGPKPPCVVEENVSVTIHGDTLSFTDSALRNVVIGFEPHPDGSFNRIYTGGATVLIEGRIVGDLMEADVTNGPCQHHWNLKKG